MRQIFPLCILGICITLFSCEKAQPQHKGSGSLKAQIKDYFSKSPIHYDTVKYFPCLISNAVIEGKSYHSIVIASDLSMFYFPILEQKGIYGNGPAWDGLIIQLIQRDLPQYQGSIQFNSEADACVIEVSSQQVQEVLAQRIHEVFTDQKLVDDFLGSVDVSLIE